MSQGCIKHLGAQNLLTIWGAASASHPPTSLIVLGQVQTTQPPLSLGRRRPKSALSQGRGLDLSLTMTGLGPGRAQGSHWRYRRRDAAHPMDPAPPSPHPAVSNTTDDPQLLLPLPAWMLVQGPSVPTGPLTLGQAALAIGAGRKAGAGGGTGQA